MFNSPRQYRYINNEKVEGQIFHLLGFEVSSRQNILVQIEEFTEHPFCFIKFYDRDHRESSDAFNRLTKKGNAPVVLGTCLHIMADFYKKNPYMSFGFTGSPTMEEMEMDSGTETKRSRVYRRIMEAVFSPKTFSHIVMEDHSVYLMLNRDYCDHNPGVQTEMLQCIKNAYPDEPCWRDLLP